MPRGKTITVVIPESRGELIESIQTVHRQRQDMIRADVRLGNQIEAITRRITGLKIEERAALERKAKRARDKGEALPEGYAEMVERLEQAQLSAMALQVARDAIVPYRSVVDKQLAALAMATPIWPAFALPIRGFGAVGLGMIIGECGDIGTYGNPGRLWKRMGLAVIDGERQRKHLDKDLAIKHGYNPRRRSIMYVLGDSLVKLNQTGPYRAYYLYEKARQMAKSEDMRPIVADMRAKRHMTKRLLRDLWRAWRHLDHLPYEGEHEASIEAQDRAIEVWALQMDTDDREEEHDGDTGDESAA